MYTGASLYDRQMPSRGDRRNRFERNVLVVGGGKRLVRVDNVDAVQGNTTQLRWSWFVGANVAVAKDLARIHRDQLAVQPLGDADRQLGLAAGRRPDDRHHAQAG